MDQKEIKSNFKKQNVFFTLAYFNALGFAPTSFEIWFHYFVFKKETEKISFFEVKKILEEGKEKKAIKNYFGFWFIPGQNKLAELRIKKQKISLEKIKKIQKVSLFFGCVPYLRGVFLTGTLAMKNASQKSDWDILVVTEKNRIWLGRFFFSLFLEIWDLRRKNNKIINRFCLNHFLTIESLRFEERNEFSANEIAFSFPIYGKKIHEKFLEANFDWLNQKKPNFCFNKGKEEIHSPFFYCFKGEKLSFLGRTIEFFLEFLNLGEKMNLLMKKLMIKKILNNPKTYRKEADIRFGDYQLVFLPIPHRNKVFEKATLFLEKINERVFPSKVRV